MGIDWETILGIDEGDYDDIDEAYQDFVGEAEWVDDSPETSWHDDDDSLLQRDEMLFPVHNKEDDVDWDEYFFEETAAECGEIYPEPSADFDDDSGNDKL